MSGEAECESVQGGGADLGYCGTMVGGGVSLVDFPSVAWVLYCSPAHPFVAVGLGEYRCGGDIGVLTVAFDYGDVGDVAIRFEPVAVNGYLSRLHAQ